MNSSSKHHVVLGLILLLAASIVRSYALPTASTAVDEARLLRYQLALDQLSQGDLDGAGVLCVQGIKTNGNSTDLNLLLAYILDKQGKTEAAVQAAAAVADDSRLAAAMVSRLRNSVSTTANSDARSITENKTPTRLQQADARLSKIEQSLLGYVNEARSKEGLSILTWNATLADISRAHSAEMRDRKYFAHESPTEELREPMDRYLAVVNDTPRLIAENIFRSWGSRHEVSEQDALGAHNSLMASPGHRANILRSNISQLGIGIVANANGDLWVTQMFIRP